MYEYIFIFIVGGKPDDITVLLSIVAEYTDWLASVSAPASPSSSQILPCRVCWSCWHDHVSLPLISMASDVNLCLSLWDPLLRTTTVILLLISASNIWRKSRSEDWPSHCPFHDGMDVFKAKMTITFLKTVEVLKMSNIGKVNSKLQCVKGILKVWHKLYVMIHLLETYSSNNVLHVYYTVCVMIECGFMFSL